MALKNITIFSKKEFRVHKLRRLRFLVWSSHGPSTSQLVSIVYFRPLGGGEPGPGSLGKGKFWVALSPDFWLVYFRKAEDMVKLFLKVSWPQLWGALV